jgi:hypothetical protein
VAPAIVSHARKIAVRRRLPARQLPHLVARTARVAARSPRALRKLVSAAGRLRTSPLSQRGVRAYRGGVGRAAIGSRAGGATGTSTCPTCGQRSYRFHGPFRLTVESI